MPTPDLLPAGFPIYLFDVSGVAVELVSSFCLYERSGLIRGFG